MASIANFQNKNTGDFRLKLLSVSDAPKMFETIQENRQILKPWLIWVDNIKTINDCVVFIEECLRNFKKMTALTMGIWVKENFVGCVGFNSINAENKRGNMGFWLSENYHGKGIMTKSCRMIINYAFEIMQMERIEILCATKNFKSRAVPQRLNFTQEGVLRHYNLINKSFQDMVMYSILKQDWRNV